MKETTTLSEQEINPLQSIELWEDDVLVRYPEADKPSKTKQEYRNYDDPVRDTVREFYRLNHRYQTYDFAMEKKKEFLQFNRIFFWTFFNSKNINQQSIAIASFRISKTFFDSLYFLLI